MFLWMVLVFFPKNRLFSIAAAAAVVADMTCFGDGAVVTSHLPGMEQSSPRAEILGLILGVQQSLECSIHSDCQYVVDAAKHRISYLLAGRSPPPMELDLWLLFDELVADRPAGLVTLIKVKAHKSIHEAKDHFDQLCCHYNSLADAAAKRAVKHHGLVSFAQLQTLHAKQVQVNKTVARFHSFLAECASLEFHHKPPLRPSLFDISVLDVVGPSFRHLPMMENALLESFPYTEAFGNALCRWARELQWAEHHEHPNTSFAELLVNFIHSTGLRPPVNVHKFQQRGPYKRPQFRMREQCGPDVQLEGYDFAEDLRTFQAALTWFRKRGASLMPGEVLVNARSLYVIGYSRPTKGVSFRVKHCCSPDPRATLQDIFTQRSACHWRFDFHVSHISRS